MRMGWTEHIALRGDENYSEDVVQNPNGRGHLRYRGINCCIILNWVLGK